MAFTTDIKKKRNSNIKKLKKAHIYSQRVKNNMIKTKELANQNENTANEYGIKQVEYGIQGSAAKLNQYGKKSFERTKTNIENITRKGKENKQIKTIKKRSLIGNQNEITNLKKKGKEIQKTVKTTQKTTKTAKKSVKRAAKRVKKTYREMKETIKTIEKGIKLSIKAMISTTKAIILGTKALVSAIIAGGWVTVLVIIVVCAIDMICCSIFGIFFSNEESAGNKTMSEVIREIDNEFSDKITDIQNANQYDEYKIKSNHSDWKDILSIYTVVISSGESTTDVISLDNYKIEKLKQIFWDVNTISFAIDAKEVEEIDENGNIISGTKKVLYIEIESKTIDEMATKYNLSEKQLKQITELQKEEYASMWNNLLYGSSANGNEIVSVAISQIGNVGGQPYWSWYGFNKRVEWCACFVSWCAEQCGLIGKGVIPKFSACVDGVAWFKKNNKWYDRNKREYPMSGEIIFFDWNKKQTNGQDGIPDHVGIVKEVKDNKIYTIEGNSGDKCKENNYEINETQILGYGITRF